MRRAIFTAVALIPALLFAFGAGAFVAARSHWGTPITTILVKNESGHQIDLIAITYTTCGTTRKITYKHSEQHMTEPSTENIRMQLVLCGEGSHITEVTLSGGQVYSSKGSYIQGGDEVIERVCETGLISEHIGSLL